MEKRDSRTLPVAGRYPGQSLVTQLGRIIVPAIAQIGYQPEKPLPVLTQRRRDLHPAEGLPEQLLAESAASLSWGRIVFHRLQVDKGRENRYKGDTNPLGQQGVRKNDC